MFAVSQTRTLAAVIFFISGGAGMIYEISWSRQFGNVFGHTVYTGAMVLASFLGGMAVGYWLAGRYRGSRPLAAYGYLEIFAAVWACVVPWLLAASELTPLGTLDSGPWQLLSMGRAVFCGLVLLPTTAALGATWPLMAAVLSPQESPSARWLSVGYALNTAGATVGSVLATALLLVFVGVTKTSYLAAAVSAACGIVAIMLARRIPLTEIARIQSTSKEPKLWRSRVDGVWWLLAAFSGFSILALEVLYLRLFSLVFHNSTYTFGAVVTVFLLALAMGSTLAGFASRYASPAVLIVWASAIGGLGIALSLATFARLTDFRYFGAGDSLAAHLVAALQLVSFVVLLPVTALGMILPITWQAVQDAPNRQSQVAGLTALSTIAGAAGSLAASFLLPVAGLWLSFAGLIAIYLTIAFVCLIANARNPLWPGFLLTLVGLVVIEFTWTTMQHTKTEFAGEEILERWESAYGWIDAVEFGDGSRLVRQNLHYGFGSSRNSVQRDYRQGHLPLLLHRDPKSVLFLGMGTGQTAAAALKHEELESIDVVELIPEAVSAARYLKETNRGLVDHPRVAMHTNDARRFLRGSGRQFDVIVSDLFVPWESHTGYLYTVEHYRAGRASLNVGGLFCQWLPLYQMGPGDFETIASSFASVFPHTVLWWVRTNANTPVLGLIGSEQPIDFTHSGAAQGYLEHHPHSGQHDTWLADGNAILAAYVGAWRADSDVPLNTDEHPRVEFFAPVSHVDNQKLRGTRMRDYYHAVLQKLPQESLIVSGFEGPACDHAWRVSEQRRLLGIE